ncbi:MAG: class I SAM-dependent methyltransferase [Cycloclasticus sp.]|uniref:class I SAM-dependent methyltransferase n=1 Tax=Cycloclasticus sp. TaxID=2024830 RepID=UPI00257C040E|nr:class I SAM-dependent methyltransferase [Cycloclasticus sp.]MBV1898679.1 class I SAM-dependent methyltransferase [Cycloclasticus sp.]
MKQDKDLHEWPIDGLERVLRCPVCGERDRKALYHSLTDKVFFCAPGKWAMYSCASCESAYLDPRPTAGSIGLAYKQYFTHVREDISSLSLLNKLKRRIETAYRNYRYGCVGSSDFFGFISALIISLYPNGRRNMDLSMRHLNRVEKGQVLLDFGCGNGDFLRRAREVGWEVRGVDFDQKAVKQAREGGLDVRVGGVEVIDEFEEKFDVISLSHVLEHVHDSVGLLEHCFRKLKLGGYIWLETPNIGSFGHQYFGANWRDLDVPRHLVIFNLKSLRSVLKAVGFVDIEMQGYNSINLVTLRGSLAIAEGKSPFSANLPKVPQGLQNKAEHIAKNDESRREFITIKARRK